MAKFLRRQLERIASLRSDAGPEGISEKARRTFFQEASIRRERLSGDEGSSEKRSCQDK
jgi:hypothetical protein